ncbi:3'-5' RNA helicase ythdc2 [Goodea atripinnis]|uniref:3'-5' RNA helicase ythdc2 n=1 Tax=Goodea atripinnis TaxID=208336 RepID=A0ABV0P5G0_9TELE
MNVCPHVHTKCPLVSYNQSVESSTTVKPLQAKVGLRRAFIQWNHVMDFMHPHIVCQELCLQTKLLAPSSCLIAEFLSKAPQPPPTHAIQSAVQMLKIIDALDQNEDLTDMGFHLADLPVEPHLGKMVLCAVVLKCLDPILTIACTLAYRDPFTLPTESSQKRAALQSRRRFTSNTFSDHMALLRAFQVHIFLFQY